MIRTLEEVRKEQLINLLSGVIPILIVVCLLFYALGQWTGFTIQCFATGGKGVLVQSIDINTNVKYCANTTQGKVCQEYWETSGQNVWACGKRVD